MGLSDVPTLHLESILEGKTGHKVLLILDGYNEYIPGTNRSIDKALEERDTNRYTILTCCPGDILCGDEEAVVEIKGFTSASAIKWIKLFVKSDKIVYQCQETLMVPSQHPLLLFMCAVIVLESNIAANTSGKTVDIAFNMVLQRAANQNFKCNPEEKKLEQWLNILNEMSWEALKKDTGQYLLNKVAARY